MKYTNLGHTEVKVSKICLGTMTWGDQNTEEEAHEQMDYALEQGVNFWDTAELYPVWPNPETHGRTENYIGNWFEKTGKRDEVVLASKVAGMGRGPMPWIRGGKHVLDRENIFAAVEGSLTRLKTDYLDLYQVHWPDRNSNYFHQRGYEHHPETDNVSIEETLSALSELVKEGKVRSIGVSNETAWGMMEYLRLSSEKGYERIVSNQNPYHLLNRQYEVGCAEVSMREDCGLLAYSPLAYGALTGKYIEKTCNEKSRFNRWPDWAHRLRQPNGNNCIKKYLELARSHDLDPAVLALAFVNQREFVTSTIIGATSMDHLKVNIDSINTEISDEILKEIELIHELIPDSCP